MKNYMKSLSKLFAGLGVLLYGAGWLYTLSNMDRRLAGDVSFAGTGHLLVLSGGISLGVAIFFWTGSKGKRSDILTDLMLIAGFVMVTALAGPLMWVNGTNARLEWCRSVAPEGYLEKDSNFSIAQNKDGEWYCANGRFQKLIDQDVAFEEVQVGAGSAPDFEAPLGWQKNQRANPFPTAPEAV